MDPDDVWLAISTVGSEFLLGRIDEREAYDRLIDLGLPPDTAQGWVASWKDQGV